MHERRKKVCHLRLLALKLAAPLVFRARLSIDAAFARRLARLLVKRAVCAQGRQPLIDGDASKEKRQGLTRKHQTTQSGERRPTLVRTGMGLKAEPLAMRTGNIIATARIFKGYDVFRSSGR